MISMVQVSKSFPGPLGRHDVLVEVSAEIGEGELVALMGPSGSGKSTIVRLCAGLDRPTAGSVVVDGVEVSALSPSRAADLRLRQVGVIFQDYTLLPELSAVENVELPLRAQRVDRASARAQAQQALADVGIAELADRRPAQMSGGQQQRVGIARAMVGGRRVLLADEPTGALDRRATQSVFNSLRQAADHGVTVVIATHDPAIQRWADRVLEVDEGSLEARVPTPEGRR